MKWILLVATSALVQAESITLDNGVTMVVINPTIGGRVMSYTGGGRSWLWANPQAPHLRLP